MLTLSTALAAASVPAAWGADKIAIDVLMTHSTLAPAREQAAQWMLQAAARGEAPLDVALAQVDALRPKKAQLPALEALAALLTESGRSTEAIATWQAIGARLPHDPRARTAAQRHLQETLPAVATDLHIRAQESGDRATYDQAAALYQDYLRQFPTAPDATEIRNNLADLYYATEQFALAEPLYAQNVSAADPAFREPAMWRLMQTRREGLIAAYGAVETRPPEAAVERRVVLPSGKERLIYAVSPAQAAFIEACDALIATNFRSDPEWTRALDENRAAIAYLPAQILFRLGRFDEARVRFYFIAFTWPDRDEAAYACSYLVDSFGDEEDLAAVRREARRCQYAGPRARWQTPPGTEDIVAFKLAEEQINRGDRAAAAETFAAYVTEYPNSKYVREALYNAAHSYEIIGRVDQANELFEQYVARYPRDERSALLLFRIASNHSAVLELEAAVQTFEMLVATFPAYAEAPTALYNAGFLRIGLGDPAGAARNLERYVHDYPAQRDVEPVLWMCADLWARVGPAESRAFLLRYLQQFPATNPDHVMEAHHRLASLAEQRSDARATQQAWDSLEAAWQRLSASGAVLHTGQHAAAMGAVRRLRKQIEGMRFPRTSATGPSHAAALAASLQGQLERGSQSAAALRDTYHDFEASSAALVLVGQAWINADPRNDAWTQRGEQELIAALDLARTERQWTPWQDQALILLNQRDPLTWSEHHRELRATVDSDVFPVAGPVQLRSSGPSRGEAAPLP